MSRYVLALDQGTTSSRAVLFDERGSAVASARQQFTQHFPRPGWVEHDPGEIWDSQLTAARGALERAGVAATELAAIGIANQRETTVVWDRATGEPIRPAIVWQSRQTADLCDRLRERGLEAEIHTRSGLFIDAYFSATKVRFILDAVDGAQARAERGELAFGTIDSWLIHRLTAGQVHATDTSNASRTMLFDIHRGQWDGFLLDALDLPAALMPEVRDSSGEFGVAGAQWLGAGLPINGVAGDQQAALFGQHCFTPGAAKNTYGTGCFLLTHTGAEARPSAHHLLTTAAWGIDGGIEYALEGSVFSAGSTIQWLRDGLGLIKSAAESEALARSVDDSGGVTLVPAFTGLGAPYWDQDARGLLTGITRGTTRAHIVRAALEAIAYQTRDIVECLADDIDTPLDRLRVDGGASANDFLMQFQADVLGIPVERPRDLEVTARGAAGLAGIAGGVWANRDEFAAATGDAGDEATVFEPAMSAAQRDELYEGWKRAVERART
ncbi:MAG: glycerol kinase GlpK [Dehalococcoidia bacterium]|nr:glycerol kinase GlpK [Dehalococcoidia bacterium]